MREQEKNHDILLQDTYEMNLKAFNLEDLIVEIKKEREQKRKAKEAGRDFEEEPFDIKNYINNVAWLPKIAIDSIYSFFISIKNEMGITGFKLDTLNIPRDSISSRVLDVLHNFRPEVQKGKGLEEVLLDYIEDMKEFNLYPPIENFERNLWELRSYKIEFFKRVLEEYRKDKEKYDKRLRIRNEALNGEIKRIDGYKEKKFEKKILEEEKDSHILLEDTYEMNISAFNSRDLAAEIKKERERRKINNQVEHGLDYEEAKEILRVKRYRSNVAWIPRIAIDCIYNFFISIKDEMGMTGFKANNLNTLNVSRDSISSRVLGVLHKFRPEVQKGKDLEEVLLDYIENLKESNFYPPIEDLEKELWNLRSYKIEFFKKVLEEYRKDKERYEKYL